MISQALFHKLHNSGYNSGVASLPAVLSFMYLLMLKSKNAGPCNIGINAFLWDYPILSGTNIDSQVLAQGHPFRMPLHTS